MNKIILKILLSLSIYAIIYSKCEDKETNRTKCLGNPNDKYPNVCCFFEKVMTEDDTTEETHCKEIPFSSYTKSETKEYFNGKLFNVSCPEVSKENFNLEQCGNIYNTNPSKKDCRKYSTYVDSCCYYSGEKNDDDPENKGEPFKKGCYWLGSKYEGSIIWAGARLECSFKFLNYSLFTLLYLIISL